MLAMVSPGSKGEAAEWSAEPSVSVRGEYNSNLLLTALPREGTFGYWTTPSVKFAGSTESLEVSGRAAADFIQYRGGVDRGLTNLYFPLAVRYVFDRETLNFDGGFTRDNTLMGELRQTGVVLSFTQRNLWNFAPSWTHALNERVSLQAGYQYNDATYENGLRLGLVDYTVNTGSGGLLYQPTERVRIGLTGSYTNFFAPQGGNLRSQIYAGQLSLTYTFSESVTGTITGGPSYVQSTIGPGSVRLSDRQLVWVGSATLKKQWDDASVQFDVAREIFPSGFGLLLQTDRIGAGMTKSFNEEWTASLAANVLFASSIASEAVAFSFPLNRYISVSPHLGWKFSQWWSLDLTYSYAHRFVEDFKETAIGNMASVMLTYFPPKLSIGR
jgi:hypothetical protein